MSITFHSVHRAILMSLPIFIIFVSIFFPLFSLTNLASVRMEPCILNLPNLFNYS